MKRLLPLLAAAVLAAIVALAAWRMMCDERDAWADLGVQHDPYPGSLLGGPRR